MFDRSAMNQVDTAIPMFYYRAEEDKEATRKEGTPRFKEVAYVQIIVPGDTKNIPDERVSEHHQNRWPRQWEAFLNKAEAPVDGTPLDQVAGFSIVDISICKECNVKTVEQLVNMPDTALSKLGSNGRRMKNLAQAYIENRDDLGAIIKYKHRSEEQQQIIEKLTGDLEYLRRKVEELEDDKPKRGRPKKED
jgi:hypothetical protein